MIFTSVEYDADAATVAVTFRPTGIAALCFRNRPGNSGGYNVIVNRPVNS
ncbi:MAG: hypothetical protein RBS39_05140 [Phycisphaerales bacterium]|nr:hypothetical protein [Phycisphaerales bacterium]